MEFKPGLEGRKEAQALFNEANGLYNKLKARGMLAGSLEAGLKELRSQLTDILCPYTIEELDRHVKKLDEKFPDWEHWYVRCGTGVGWESRPRSPDHPLWHLHSRAPEQ